MLAASFLARGSDTPRARHRHARGGSLTCVQTGRRSSSAYTAAEAHTPTVIAGGEPCPRPMITAAIDPATNVALMMIVTVGPLTGTITADAGSGGNDGGERRIALRYTRYPQAPPPLLPAADRSAPVRAPRTPRPPATATTRPQRQPLTQPPGRALPPPEDNQHLRFGLRQGGVPAGFSRIQTPSPHYRINPTATQAPSTSDRHPRPTARSFHAIARSGRRAARGAGVPR